MGQPTAAAGSGNDGNATSTAGSGDATTDVGTGTTAVTTTGTPAGDSTGSVAGPSADSTARGKAGTNAGANAGRSADADAGTTADDNASGEDVDGLPEWARKRIRDLTKENGDNRIKAKTATDKAREQAKENAERLQSFIDGFAKVIGLTTDGEDDKPKTLDEAMAKLSRSEEAIASAAGEHRQLQVQLAVWQSAAGLGANTAELMDSHAFLTQIGKLDPSAEGFREQLTQLISAQIEANPTRFKAAPVVPVRPAQSGGEFTGGTGGRTDDTMSIEDHLRQIDPVARARSASH